MTSLGLSKSEDSVFLLSLFSYRCDISEQCREGGEAQLTVLNAGKFDSWTQTRNTDLNSKSYSIFVFALCSVSASLCPAFLSGTVKDMTQVLGNKW